MSEENNRAISFVIKKRLGVLSQSGNGWKKELNLVSWNGNTPKLDIREWSPDHMHMSKGITLRNEEARSLQWNLYRWFTGDGKPEEASQPTESSEVPFDEEPQDNPEIQDIPDVQDLPDIQGPPEFPDEQECFPEPEYAVNPQDEMCEM
jgi:hypothetical protein